MLVKNVSKVKVYEKESNKEFGEPKITWKIKKNPDRKDGYFILNIQQNINELDRKSTGDVDFERRKAITTNNYNIKKGDGISLDISSPDILSPEFIVIDDVKVGSTTMYILEKNND